MSLRYEMTAQDRRDAVFAITVLCLTIAIIAGLLAFTCYYQIPEKVKEHPHGK